MIGFGQYMDIFWDPEEGEGCLEPSDNSHSYQSMMIQDKSDTFCENDINNDVLGRVRSRCAGLSTCRFDSAEEVIAPELGERKFTDDKGTAHEGYTANTTRRKEVFPEYEDRSSKRVDGIVVHRAAMSHFLNTAQHTIGLPLISVIDFQQKVVYLKASSGIFVSTRPRLLSFFDWIMNLHHSTELAQEEQLHETHTIIDDAFLHDVLGFNQYVVGPPRIRSVIGHPIFANCRSDDKDCCEENTFVGFIYAMDRVSHASHRVDLGSITSFARVIGGILGPGDASWESIRQVSSRIDRLQYTFVNASIPLMIVRKQGDGQIFVEAYNEAAASLLGKTESIGSLLDLRQGKSLHTVALSRYHEESLSARESVAAALCIALVSSSSFGLDATKCGQYHMVYSPTKPTSSVPQEVLDRGEIDAQTIYNMRYHCKFSCKYQGTCASLETFKCLGGSTPTMECVTSIMSLKHDNILRKIRSGSQCDGNGNVKDIWILQEIPSMGTLHELIFSGGIPSGCLKSLVVALSALDIARGIQQVHNASLVYSRLNPKNVYVQKDLNDTFRGWRLALGIPDVFDNLCRFDPKHSDLYTFSHGGILSSCPQRCFGCMPSITTDLYSFGIILWEMWESFSVWPQIYEEKQLLDKFCFEKDSISKYQYGMPDPLGPIFSMCILQEGDISIKTNEKIISMLEDYVSSAITCTMSRETNLTRSKSSHR